MEMMIQSDKSYSKEELIGEIETKFGKEAKFHTCSAQDMSAKEIVEFLKSKGKFIETEGKIKTNKDKICNH